MQSAEQHATDPKAKQIDFIQDFKNAGFDRSDWIDDFVKGANLDKNNLVAPNLQELLGNLKNNLTLMSRPVIATKGVGDKSLVKRCVYWEAFLNELTKQGKLSLDKYLNSNACAMGTKAFNLLRMSKLGMPVPAALVIGTHYTKEPKSCFKELFSVGLPALELTAKMRLGDPKNPLILSVRSGAPVSMPGMMETLLNIGLCESTLGGFLRQTGNPRLVWDSYRRLIATYGEVVAGIAPNFFEDALDTLCNGTDERNLGFDELRALSSTFLSLYEAHALEPFPQDTKEQLKGAIKAVFDSWHSKRAFQFRETNHLSNTLGTAVTLQRMVFGNSGTHAGSGVGFTRNPTNGEKRLWIDFLLNAQGEDVVSGRRNVHGHETLENLMPEVWLLLQKYTLALELEFLDMQDFEFTVESGQLFMLQTRSGKRTKLAAAKIALDLFDEGIIDKREVIERTLDFTQASLVLQVLSNNSDAAKISSPLSAATTACSGIASGEIALDEAFAKARHALGVKVILMRQDTQTNDIAALEYSSGLLTARGARTSHAAVVARQLGKVCLVGCQHLKINLVNRRVSIGQSNLSEGDIVTLDGNDGQVYFGSLSVIDRPDTELYKRVEKIRHNHPKVHSKKVVKTN